MFEGFKDEKDRTFFMGLTNKLLEDVANVLKKGRPYLKIEFYGEKEDTLKYKR
jgi:hypothetical protein